MPGAVRVDLGSVGPGRLRIGSGKRCRGREGRGERLARAQPVRPERRAPVPLRPDRRAGGPWRPERRRAVDLLRGPAAGAGREAGGRNHRRRRGRAGLRQYQLRLGEVVPSRLRSAVAAPRPGPDRPARHRPLAGSELPAAATGDGSGADRGRILREPARGAVSGVHLGRVRCRHRGRPHGSRSGADHPLRRLIWNAARAGVLGSLRRQPALDGALLRLPGRRSVLADDLPGGDASAEAELRQELGLPRARRGSLWEEGIALLVGRRAALQARPRPDPAHRRSAQRHARVPARGGHLVAELISGPQPGGHRVLGRRPRPPRPHRPRRASRRWRLPLLLHRNGHGGRVQRLSGGVGSHRRLRPAHRPARSGDRRLPPPPAVRAPHGEPVDDPPGHRSDRMPRLAAADGADGTARAGGRQLARGAAGPGALRRVRRHHHRPGGPPGGGPLPVIATPDRPQPRTRLRPLLPVPLAGGPLDPALHRGTS